MFDLPDVVPYRLTRAPLAQALAQVRYPLQARLGTLEGVALIQERLADRYPYLEPATAAGGIEVQFGPAGAQAALSSSASHSSSSRTMVTASRFPDSATLSVGDAYMGATDFRERFLELLTVLGSVGRISRCDRIAARYLTLATMPPGEPDRGRVGSVTS